MKKVKPLTDKELEDLRTRNNENRKMNGSTAVLVDRLIATIDKLEADLEYANNQLDLFELDCYYPEDEESICD